MTQATPTRVRFTRRDLELFPEDGKRRELIGGELYVAPAPSTRHQRIVWRLVLALGDHLRQSPVGEAFVAPVDVFLLEDETVEPDLVYVSSERSEIVTNRAIVGPPDWVVEVLSPGSRDYDLETKRKLYERSGVPAYWAVDPEAGVVHAWEGGVHTLFGPGGVAHVSSLPGFELPLSELLAP